MIQELIDRWAALLCGYCLRVVPGETILVGSEWEGSPLVAACAREIILRGAHPLVRIELPGLSEFFLERATEEQLARVPEAEVQEGLAIDGRIRIIAESDVHSRHHIDPARQAIHDRARRIPGPKRWVATQYPTAAYAQAAAMSVADYESFVTAAMFLDRADPAAAWEEIGTRQEGLLEQMSKVRSIRIEAKGTDLTLSVARRTWINSDGRRNMPSGEIFTGPVENSANGRIRCGFPAQRDGRMIEGIELEFAAGKVVSGRADRGESYLLAMLDLDRGARRLGELGIGLNQGIERFTGSILYDEKIGGTIHLALGQSYPETGGKNQSALHWDLIVDTRKQGKITADGELVMKNGKWFTS